MRVYINIMTGRYLAAALLAAAVFQTEESLYAGRFESVSFSELNGDYCYLGGRPASAGFETSLTSDETESLAAESVSYAAGSGREKRGPVPSQITNLQVVDASPNSMTLSWSAPDGDWERNNADASRYIIRYSTRPIETVEDFMKAAEYPQQWAPLARGATETHVITGLTTELPYYFGVESVNEHLVRSELSVYIPPSPMPPLNFNLSLDPFPDELHLNWLPPLAYANRVPFSSAGGRYASAITGYKIYRSTVPRNGQWEAVAVVSSGTLTWVGSPPVSSQEYYYMARASNAYGESAPSLIRAQYSGDGYVVAPDMHSMLEIPRKNLAPFLTSGPDPMSARSVVAASHPEELGGRVLKSLEFTAYKGGLEKDPMIDLTGWAYLHIRYKQDGPLIYPSRVLPAPDQISVYWHNGSKWIQLYGKIDAANQEILVKTSMLGKYQIRSVERAGGFNMDKSGLSNRLITPNGDGKNDTAGFVFDNPRDSAVTGKIFDLKGAFVADMKNGPIGNSLEWDGKANGQAVSGGVYIYQIEAEDKVTNGTIVVIR